MRRRNRRKGSRGAALVEAAIITPLFVLLIFGLLEWGYGFLDRLSVKNASLSGARVGSSEGTNGIADYDILQAVKKSTGGMGDVKIKYVIVYKAASYTASVPAACLTASSSGPSVFCNRYTGADFAQASTNFGCAPGDIDLSWCPSNRKTAQSGVYGPPDYIGVFVQGRHDNITGFFGKGFDFKADTVIRLEPQKLA
jgi:hypothetical protein